MYTAREKEVAKEIMNDVFRKVGKNYGYENVSADFVSFKQFKLQWQRSFNCIAFRVSDYMVDAPEDVMEDLADSIFAKIAGKEGLYSANMRSWVLSDDFSTSKRPVFIQRGRYLSKNAKGKNKNLDDSIKRLVLNGLLRPDHNIKAVWNRDTRSDLAATYSVLMRTIMISSILDEPDTPDDVLDYVIYHQYLRICEGARTFGTNEEPAIDLDDRMYVGHEEAEKELDKLCLAL